MKPGVSKSLTGSAAGGAQQENCFETTIAVTAWLWGTRNPTTTDRVTVEIGPGNFDGMSCLNAGHVTFRGSGREVTVFRGVPAGLDRGSDASNCDELEFIDMRFEGSEFGFAWHGGGSSTWSDVDIIGLDDPTAANFFSIAWDGDSCGASTGAVHYFFGSRVIAHGNFNGNGYPGSAFWEECAENWFYGGEITRVMNGNSFVAEGSIVDLRGPAKLHAFGTAIRMIGPDFTGMAMADGIVLNKDSFAAGSDNGTPEFHMHGGIISIVLPGLGSSPPPYAYVNGIRSDGGFAHTPDTAFAMRLGGHVGTRLKATDETEIRSPYQWESGVYPPLATSEASTLVSLHGQDTYIETDCGADGACAGGSEAHLMTYDVACTTNGAWRDVTTGRCRGDTVDPLASRVTTLEGQVAALQALVAGHGSDLSALNATTSDHESRITALEP